jgi:hypothetical protein
MYTGVIIANVMLVRVNKSMRNQKLLTEICEGDMKVTVNGDVTST